ncbi:UDP-3-O-(3-hydroxymyristoyl)glucosamine N-acyltransferase [Asticcacaulis machinosus]|uniref:UDP-3-O-acylglucosamine N-acyltransferase n=1 Tax=Asticcacaulis machinosus TaxID=2984211 RepID=A0ABT5HEV5_9CAUL|nr:UDP-3-O-(3-hydroxymyristoyl)glucosamine N-acyltransferase [Asticcacaulis machinosus]MDC7674791.1 UDP-3-O-(3-hydroxymyristoyl)glucosamine N-acyltransferase [Asticcacaulis machinosus]
MPDLRFFEVASSLSLDQVIALTRASLLPGVEARGHILACAPLASAGDGEAAFFSDRRYLGSLKKTQAGFVFVTEDNAALIPEHSVALVVKSPQAAWARLANALYTPLRHDGTVAIHPTARIEDGVYIGIGVVIGQNAEIGSRTRLEAYSVIGPGCTIGRHCRVGAHATLYCTLMGDRVQIASGAHIGEAGFGVSGDEQGLLDVPQLGRVILQDNVSVGSGTCIDRGAYDDTVIGEATKIDNLVQIAHNVQVGRQCIIAAHAGISGSARIGDGAMFGGRAGLIDHIAVGAGAKVAAGAVVYKDVPAGEMWSGFPAKPSRQFLREAAWLSKQASQKDKG